MRDNFLNIIKILIIFFSCNCILIAEELNISASKVSFDKKKSTVIWMAKLKRLMKIITRYMRKG